MNYFLVKLGIFIILMQTFGLARADIARGEVYYFVDRDGTRHYTNVPSDSRYQRLMAMPDSLVKRPYISPGRLSYILRTTERISEEHGLDPALVKAVIKAESDFNPQAISSAGAIGLMQLMPLTALRWAVGNPLDPAENILGGVRHLRHLISYFDGNLPLVLAAYHAGESRVERHRGIPPIPETQQYVQRVLKFYDRYRGDRAPRTVIHRVAMPTGEIIYTDAPARYRGAGSP